MPPCILCEQAASLLAHGRLLRYRHCSYVFSGSNGARSASEGFVTLTSRQRARAKRTPTPRAASVCAYRADGVRISTPRTPRPALRAPAHQGLVPAAHEPARRTLHLLWPRAAARGQSFSTASTREREPSPTPRWSWHQSYRRSCAERRSWASVGAARIDSPGMLSSPHRCLIHCRGHHGD